MKDGGDRYRPRSTQLYRCTQFTNPSGVLRQRARFDEPTNRAWRAAARGACNPLGVSGLFSFTMVILFTWCETNPEARSDAGFFASCSC